MDHYEEQRKLLKFKDDVIWKLSQELKKKYDYYQDEFDKETRNEMNESIIISYGDIIFEKNVLNNIRSIPTVIF